MATKKHYLIGCTLIKSHPDIGSVFDYLMDNGFIPDIREVPDGIHPWYGRSESDAVAYAYKCGDGLNFKYPPSDGRTYEASILLNASGTRIEILVAACGSSADVEHGIARRALEAYLASISPASPIVFHLGGVLADAYAEHAKQHKLPSIPNAIVTIEPFHAETIGRILNNISISEFDQRIERILMDTLGIDKDEAKFEHVFDSDTKGELGLTDSAHSEYDNYFTYRGKDFSLQLVSDFKGKREMKIRSLSDATETVFDDIHELKEAIDENFFEIWDSPAEPVEPAKSTDGKPTFASLMDDFTRRMKEVVSCTPEGEDWLAEFNEVASPREIVWYYLYTYGLSGTAALDKWKASTKGKDNTKYDKDVEKIFDAIFCPFCEQRKGMAFGSQEGYLKLNPGGTVDYYPRGMYQETFTFPNCPACGKPIETK